MSLVAESPGFLQVFSDGTVKRFAPQSIHPHKCPHKTNFKDVTIDPSKPITARIFLPHDDSSSSSSYSTPLLVYFHGGGFCIGSTTWLGYHNFLEKLSSMANSIVVSIDYRLAPENRLPIAYEDCYAALEWLGSSSEPWLRRADLGRVFVAGDSAGGNIAHHIAVKAVKEGVSGVRVRGVIPIHPFFGSEERTELEKADGSADKVAMNDMFWKLSLPEGSDRGFYGCDFEKGVSDDIWGVFPPVLVLVAGLDFLKERGVKYADFLKRKGVQNVNLVEAQEEPHVFHIWNPESEAAFQLQKQMAEFMNKLTM